MFDVIVVGAGPAGAVAATVLAREGARVLVLERERFPRDKLCGDTLNPGAVRTLAGLGLLERIEPAAIPLDGMVVSGEHGVSVAARYGDRLTGRSILRRDLDQALATAAGEAGARVEHGVTVRGPLIDTSAPGTRVRGVVIQGRDGRAIRVPAPMVIAADGRRSRLAMAVGLLRHPSRPRRWAVGSYFEGVAGVGTMGEMHVRRDRYVGIAPVPTGDANVCVVTGDRRALRDPERLLRDSLARDPMLMPRFAGARMLRPPVTLGPLAIDARAPGVPGLLLAGDAAGFIDPMTGDGIHLAIRGGVLAAGAALKSGAHERPAHDLLREWRAAALRSKLRFNRVLRALVDVPAAIDAASYLSAVAPRPIERVIAYAGDAR